MSAITALSQGKVIAYPTEAVFGLGCDPDNESAVLELLNIKQRPVEKGLILVAANIEQLAKYADFDALTSEQLHRVQACWPGPFTWIVPKQATTPAYLTGDFDSIAVRVSAHPKVQQLCREFGKPLVSTSANITGEAPNRTAESVKAALGDALAFVVDAPCGPSENPTQIRDARTQNLVRASNGA